MLGDDDIDIGEDDFGTCGTFTLADGTSLCVTGIFTNVTGPVSISGIEIEAVKPMFDVATSRVDGLVNTKDTVVIDGDSYIVEDRSVNGPTGRTVLGLKTKRA